MSMQVLSRYFPRWATLGYKCSSTESTSRWNQPTILSSLTWAKSSSTLPISSLKRPDTASLISVSSASPALSACFLGIWLAFHQICWLQNKRNKPHQFISAIGLYRLWLTMQNGRASSCPPIVSIVAGTSKARLSTSIPKRHHNRTIMKLRNVKLMNKNLLLRVRCRSKVPHKVFERKRSWHCTVNRSEKMNRGTFICNCTTIKTILISRK